MVRLVQPRVGRGGMCQSCFWPCWKLQVHAVKRFMAISHAEQKLGAALGSVLSPVVGRVVVRLVQHICAGLHHGRERRVAAASCRDVQGREPFQACRLAVWVDALVVVHPGRCGGCACPQQRLQISPSVQLSEICALVKRCSECRGVRPSRPVSSLSGKTLLWWSTQGAVVVAPAVSSACKYVTASAASHRVQCS